MKCDHCCQENGKRSRCPKCDAMVCRECVNDHSESHNQLNPIRTRTEVAKKTIAEIKLRGEPRSYFASGPRDVFIENASGIFESLKKYLQDPDRSRRQTQHRDIHTLKAPGKIFATTHGFRANLRNRHNHQHRDQTDTPYFYTT